MKLSLVTVWIIIMGLWGHTYHGQKQRVVVELQLDSKGKIIAAKAVTGNHSLFDAAVTATRSRTYRADCDSRGNPKNSTVTLFVDFDEHGKFVQFEFPIRAGDILIESRIIKRIEPEYPIELKKAGVRGAVVIEVHVDKDGEVTEAHAIRGDSRLIPYATKAVLQWKYQPFYLECEAMPTIETITIIFPSH